MGDSFTGQKTQPTASKYWRKKRYKSKKNPEKANNAKYSNTTKRHTYKNTASPLVYTSSMGWLGGQKVRVHRNVNQGKCVILIRAGLPLGSHWSRYSSTDSVCRVGKWRLQCCLPIWAAFTSAKFTLRLAKFSELAKYTILWRVNLAKFRYSDLRLISQELEWDVRSKQS